MKKPAVSFNKDTMLSLLVNHGEKMVAGLIAVAACSLAWGGVSAFRNMKPAPGLRPDAIFGEAELTADCITEVDVPPAEDLASARGLPEKVARWLTPNVVPPPSHALLNKPLFTELARRGSPEILPVEDLRAVAGAAVLAVRSKPAGDRASPERAPAAEAAANPPKPAKPPKGGRSTPPAAALGILPEIPGLVTPPGMPPLRPDMPQEQGKVVPYVLVTGLIPVMKQKQEYDRRLGNTSLRDATLDVPSWANYQIEKTEVLPGAAEKWTPVDMKAMARRYGSEWAGFQSEPFQPLIALGSVQERRDPNLCPIPLCSPLPQLADGTWGFKAIHPWFAEYLQRNDAERRTAELEWQKQSEAAGATNVFGNSGAPGMPGGLTPPGAGLMPPGAGLMPPGAGLMPPGAGLMPPGAGLMPPGAGLMPPGAGLMPPGPGMLPGAIMPQNTPDGMPDPRAQAGQGPEYRLFRFIDFAVVPGRTYRYRVKLVCWNPNYNVSPRHLSDAAIAESVTLESAPSQASSPVTASDGAKLLAQPMKRQDLKRVKGGMVAAFILGGNPDASGLSLRQILMEPGGIANVDPDLNKRGDPRSVGDAIVTDRVLLDVRGKLEDRSETRTGKPTPPPEPLEMIFLKPDGGFEVTSAADSQPDIDRYHDTLKTEGSEAGGGRPGQPSAVEGPLGNPLSPKK